MNKLEFRKEIIEFLEKKRFSQKINEKKLNKAYKLYCSVDYHMPILAYDMAVRIVSKGKECILPD